MRRGPRCSIPEPGARCATPCLIREYKDQVDDRSHRHYPMIEVRGFGPQPVTLQGVCSNKEERQSEFGRITHLYLVARGIDDDNRTARGSCQRQRDPMTTRDCEVTRALH